MTGHFDLAGAIAIAMVGTERGDPTAVWRFIQRYARHWLRPIATGDGRDPAEVAAASDRLGHALPRTLRDAYELFGRRDDLIAVEDPMLGPDELRVDDSGTVLVYREESQGVVEWGIPVACLSEVDPPTVFRYVIPGEDAWQPYLHRLSVACLEQVLSETVVAPIVSTSGPPAGALADQRPLDDETMTRTERSFARLPIPPYPVGDPLRRWFAGPDVMILADQGPNLLRARARTVSALDAVRATLPGPWLVG